MESELQVTMRPIYLGRFLLPIEQSSAADNHSDEKTPSENEQSIRMVVVQEVISLTPFCEGIECLPRRLFQG